MRKLVGSVLFVVLLATLPLISGCASAPTPTPAPTSKPAAPAPKAEAATPKPAAATPAAPVTPKPETSASKPAAPAGPLATVKVGTTQGAASDAALYIAMEKGYFEEEGINVDLVNFTGIPQMTPPLSTGDLDVGGGIIGAALFNAVERGINLKLVADKSSVQTGKFMYGSVVVRKDLIDSGAVKEIKDLKGKKIGVSSLQSGVEALVDFVLEKGGLSIKDVDLVTLSYPDAVVALSNKAIDAAWLIEPAQTTAIDKGVASLWAPGSVAQYTGGVAPGASMVYSAKFASNVDLARKFMVAYLRGVRDYIDAFAKGKNTDQVIAIMMKDTSLKDRAMYDKMRMTYTDPNGNVDVTSAQMVVDYMKKMGYYKGNLNAKDLIDPQFAEYAVQKLGQYK